MALEKHQLLARTYEQDPHHCAFCNATPVVHRCRAEPPIVTLMADGEAMLFADFTACAGCFRLARQGDGQAFITRLLTLTRANWPHPQPQPPPALMLKNVTGIWEAYQQALQQQPEFSGRNP